MMTTNSKVMVVRQTQSVLEVAVAVVVESEAAAMNTALHKHHQQVVA
jgi:hypothetical protein